MQPHRQRGVESGFDLRRPAGAEVPAFLTPGTGFVENCFSLDWWRGAAGAAGAGRPVQAVMGPGEQQMTFSLLALGLPLALRLSS